MLLPPSSTKLRTHRSLNKDPPLRRPSRAACSASVSHLSAISMKSDLCSEVRAASANRMHSAALLRTWSKLDKCASISFCSTLATIQVWILGNDRSRMVHEGLYLVCLNREAEP